MQKINLAVLIGLLVLVFWKFLLPGPRVANDYPYIYQEAAKSAFDTPYLWSERGAEGLGENVISTLWSWPVDFLYGFGTKAGLDFSGLERILGVIPFIFLGVWGITRFLKRAGVSGWTNVAVSFFYLANTYILLLIDGGQVSIALAYAWFPTAYLAWENGASGGPKKKVISGLALSVLGYLDIRFLYILGILILFRFLYELIYLKGKERLRWFIDFATSALIALLIFSGLNTYWILPAVKANSFSLPVLLQRSLDASSFSFANIGHSLNLLSSHWYKNVFGKITEIKAEFLLIPAIAFLAPILKKKNRKLGFWLLISVLGIFLVKGTNPPLAGVYSWLSANIPGFFLLRDSSKFFFFIALGYSFLIAVTVSQLQSKIRIKFPIVPLAMILYLLYLVSPTYLGKMTGMLSDPPNQLGYFDMAKKINKEQSFGRILWIPSKAPLGYSSPKNPSVEALRLLNIRPFSAAVKGTYETTNFLREPYIGQILDIAGISYIAYPFPDTRREELKADNIDYYHQFVNKLSGASWADGSDNYGTVGAPISVIKTKTSQDKFFVAENSWLVEGSDDIYSKLVSVPNFQLRDNALVFMDQKPDMPFYIDPKAVQSFSGTILHDKSHLDYWAGLVVPELFVYPAQGLGLSPDESGWWKREGADVISWRGFLQDKYGLDNSDFDFGGGWAVAEGERQLKVESDKLWAGDRLLARVIVSPKGGSLSFYQNETLIGTINTFIENPEKVVWEADPQERALDKANFIWFEVGDLVSDGQILIKSNGEINVVNVLVSTPPKLFEGTKKIAHYGEVELDLSKTKPEELESQFSVESQVEASYEEISPTQYKVKISGLNNNFYYGVYPIVLVFSSTYSPFWKLDGNSAFPVYGFLNGFTVFEDGEYTIYYEPQKYVIPGLWISGITLVAVLGFLLLKR